MDQRGKDETGRLWRGIVTDAAGPNAAAIEVNGNFIVAPSNPGNILLRFPFVQGNVKSSVSNSFPSHPPVWGQGLQLTSYCHTHMMHIYSTVEMLNENNRKCPTL